MNTTPHVYDEAHLNHGHWIETYTGRKFHQTNPRPDDIHLEDIAHSLSLINRYNGHTIKPFSVAAHVLFVSHMCQNHLPSPPPAIFGSWRRIPLLGLMHDFEEAYTGDIVGSLKMTMKAEIPGFREWYGHMVDNINNAIYSKVNVELPTEREERLIKYFDVRALAIESKLVLPYKGHTYHHIVVEHMAQISQLEPWLPAKINRMDEMLCESYAAISAAQARDTILERFGALTH